MICRCLKTGIGGKSGDHRAILKACDAAISVYSVHVSHVTHTKLICISHIKIHPHTPSGLGVIGIIRCELRVT